MQQIRRRPIARDAQCLTVGVEQFLLAAILLGEQLLDDVGVHADQHRERA